LKLRNVDTPEEAKFLKGLKVFIDEIDVPEKTIFETIGFELIEESTSQKIGTIVEVEPGAMQDLLVIQTGKDTKLLPAVPEFLVNIDWDTRQVFVELIEGLL
jgi:ribosomal 30S subunit maturation factor RimM